MKNKIEKIKSIIIKRKKWLLLALVIILFIEIAENIFKQEIMKIDILAYKYIVEKTRVNWLTGIMNFITNLGGTYILPIICIAVLIFAKEKRVGITMFINLILISIANIILKNIVQRPRPEGYRLISERGYSFPSGHSMVSTAFYGLVIYFIYSKIKNKKLKYILNTIFLLLIILIGFSRVYLGVHYASDVIAGFLVSIAYLICFITIYNLICIGVKNEEKKNNEKISKNEKEKIN